MPASILQYTEVSAPIGATNIAVSNALVANDLLVLATFTGQGGGRNAVPSGFGTWALLGGVSNLQTNATAAAVKVNTATGLTGTGTIVLTVTGEAVRAVLFVVRDLIGPKVYSYAIGATVGTVGVEVPVGGASHQPTANQALLSLASATPGAFAATWSFPEVGSTPSAGVWTRDNASNAAAANSGNFAAVAHVLGGDGLTAYRTTYKHLSGNGFGVGSVSLLLGEPAAGSATLIQSSTEALVRGTPTAALEQTYAEALVRGAPDAVLEHDYVEVLARVDNVVYLEQSYLEVLTGAAVAAPTFKRGWGILV